MKTTTPAFKQVYRLYDDKGMAIADLLTLREEVVDDSQAYLLFDPEHPWKQKRIDGFRAQSRLNLIWQAGKCVQSQPSLTGIRQFAQQEMASLWPEVKRLENPHGYYVDLSKALWKVKQHLIEQYAGD